MKMPRLLVADDNNLMRCAIVEILSERYQIVGAVADGQELVESAECLLPDAIVTDIFMMRMDGMAARSELIARQLAIPFVFVSALDKEVVQLVPDDAAVGFVHKVEILDHLLNAVAAVLSGQRYLSPYYKDPHGFKSS
jgi:DNA-binding NarL/FixJ family response regulator